MNVSDIVAEFASTIRSHGADFVGQIIPDAGKIQRLYVRGDKQGSKNLAYIVHTDGRPAGWFSILNKGIEHRWKANGYTFEPRDWQALKAKIDADRIEREREQTEAWARAAKRAQKYVAEATTPATAEHPYLARKRVQPHGLMIGDLNCLVVPLYDETGTIWSCQEITPDGGKLFTKGGRVGGCFHVLDGQLTSLGDRIVIAEGFATCASIREATGATVVMALDAGNLIKVARVIRQLAPTALIVIAADDDRKPESAGNVGIDKAEAAAAAIGAAVAVPVFSDGRPGDFNDLAIECGAEAIDAIVSNAFRAARETSPPPERDREESDEPAFAATPERPAPDSEPAAETAAETPDDWEEPLLEAVAELNGRYFVASMSGQSVIASLVNDREIQRERLVFSKPSDVSLLYAHRHFLVGHTRNGGEIWKGLGEAWLHHRHRLTYQQIAFIPKGACPADTFNLWRGFGVEPKAGAWSTIRDHLHAVVCSGNDADFAWLLGWFAYCVQYPETRAEVAVVLRGKKGTGKGSVGQILIALFRNHALQITQARHLTGNFNSHLVDALALFVDEAFWAGDKQGEGTLKALITEPTLMIEPKHVNAFTVLNRLKIIMASNADWVVPASADERRYFVLDVPDTRKGDRAYFSRLHDAIAGDELAAFLDYLLEMDLSGFDHRNPPHTQALNTQKLIGGDSLTRFWVDCLCAGEIMTLPDPGWPDSVPVQEFHSAYLDHARDHGERHPLTDERMGAALKALMPDKWLRRSRPRGEGPRPYRYLLPTLERCRAAFLQAMNIETYDWPDRGGRAVSRSRIGDRYRRRVRDSYDPFDDRSHVRDWMRSMLVQVEQPARTVTTATATGAGPGGPGGQTLQTYHARNTCDVIADSRAPAKAGTADAVPHTYNSTNIDHLDRLDRPKNNRAQTRSGLALVSPTAPTAYGFPPCRYCGEPTDWHDWRHHGTEMSHDACYRLALQAVSP